MASFAMFGGDTTHNNGNGGLSIYGHTFDDEDIWYPHTHKGVLSMSVKGPNQNGSQFTIQYKPAPHLNQAHTVFGRVISGFEICEKAEKVKVNEENVPQTTVKITDCGELTGDWKLSEDAADYLPTYAKEVEAPMMFHYSK